MRRAKICRRRSHTLFPKEGAWIEGGGREAQILLASFAAASFLPSHTSPPPSAISPPPPPPSCLPWLRRPPLWRRRERTVPWFLPYLTRGGAEGDDNVDNPCVTLIFDMLSISAHAGDRRRRRFHPSSFLPCLRAVPLPLPGKGRRRGNQWRFFRNQHNLIQGKEDAGRERGGRRRRADEYAKAAVLYAMVCGTLRYVRRTDTL